MKSPAPGRLLVRLRPRTRFTTVVVLFAFWGVFVTAGLVAITGDERQVQAGSVVVDDSVADAQALTGEPVAAIPRKPKPTRAEGVAAIPRKLKPTRAEVAARVARIRRARQRAAATPQAAQLVVSPPAPALSRRRSRQRQCGLPRLRPPSHSRRRNPGRPNRLGLTTRDEIVRERRRCGPRSQRRTAGGLSRLSGEAARRDQVAPPRARRGRSQRTLTPRG